MDPKSSRFSSANNEIKSLNLPFGYRFDPTGIELIDYYLIPKLKGEELPSHYIEDIDDIYNYEPQQLPFNQLEHLRDNEAFFFTLDSRENSAEESRIRTTPNGYWKVYRDNVPVDRGDEVIGFATKLLYHDVHGNKTDWKMIEYKCHPSQIPTTSTNVESYIVCKIKLRKKEEKCLVQEIISEDEK